MKEVKKALNRALKIRKDVKVTKYFLNKPETNIDEY